MSAAVKEALATSKDLGKNERLVVVAIAAHANTEGDAWPSVGTIAEYVGCSERTVQRALAKLVQLGRLVIRQAQHIATRVYRLVFPGVTNQQAGVTNQQAGVTKAGPGGDTQRVTRSEDHQKTKGSSWRTWLPKGHPDRRGAALPPTGAHCPKHRGSLAGNCGSCRGDALAGDR